MKLHSFQELVTRIIHISTRDGKPIPVRWSGTGAWTTTSCVNLPALPAGTILTPHQFSVFLGYALHEGPGHQTHSDLALFARESAKRNNPTFHYILNLLEDIRIENADIARYPGDRRYLDSTHQFVDDKIPTDKCTNPDLMGLIYKEVFVQYRNFDSGRIRGRLGAGPIRDALRALPSCTSTADCATLADKIVALLEEELPPPPQPQPREEDEDESEGEGGASDHEGDEDDASDPDSTDDGEEPSSGKPSSDSDENESEGKSESKGEGEGEGESADGQDGAGGEPNENDAYAGAGAGNGKENPSLDSNTSHASAMPEPDPEGWESLTEIKNILRELEKEILGEPTTRNNSSTIHQGFRLKPGAAIFPPVDISIDRIFVPSAQDMAKYNETRAKLAPQILALKKMFRIYLQARSRKSWLRGLDDGPSLDRERLHIVATGETTIFRDFKEKSLIDTSISLMVDLSMSMNIEMTRAAAILLAESLASIPQIKLAISGFSTQQRSAPDYNNPPPPNTGRKTPMEIQLFKDFAEPYLKSRAELGAIRRQRLTPLGDAYGKALEQLIPRSEPRRIIFLLSDGRPEFEHGANHSDFLLMSRIRDRAKTLGIETLGLGIGPNARFLETYVQSFVHLQDFQSLPRDLMDALKRMLK